MVGTPGMLDNQLNMKGNFGNKGTKLNQNLLVTPDAKKQANNPQQKKKGDNNHNNSSSFDQDNKFGGSSSEDSPGHLQKHQIWEDLEEDLQEHGKRID